MTMKNKSFKWLPALVLMAFLAPLTFTVDAQAAGQSEAKAAGQRWEQADKKPEPRKPKPKPGPTGEGDGD